MPCVLLAVSRWGVWCTLGTPLGVASPTPPTHSPVLRPPRLHFLQLCHLVIQSTRTTLFCRPNTRPRKCTSRSTRWDTSLGGLPVLACVLLAVSRWGCFTRWDTSLGGLPVLACVQLAVSRWGVLHPLGYVPRRPSRPCLCPARCIPLWVLHPLGYVPRRPSRPCLRPARCIPLGGAPPAGIRSSEAFPSLPVSCSLYPAVGASPAGIRSSEAFLPLLVSCS